MLLVKKKTHSKYLRTMWCNNLKDAVGLQLDVFNVVQVRKGGAERAVSLKKHGDAKAPYNPELKVRTGLDEWSVAF